MEIAVVEHLLLGSLEGRDTPEVRVDAREQLAHRERLGDVVVRADLEAEELVPLLDAGRQHDDRDAPRLVHAAELSAEGEPVDVG